MLTREEALSLLRKEVVPALGCTEPAAVALAAAAAAEAVGGEVSFVKVTVNAGIYKNGMAVGIPGFDRVGLKYAAALGAFAARPDLGLEVFSAVDDDVRREAMTLVDAHSSVVELAQGETGLYCLAEVESADGMAKALIRGSHGNIVYIEKNGQILLDKEQNGSAADDTLYRKLTAMKIKEIKNLVENMPDSDLDFMLEGRDMNTRMADSSAPSSRIAPALDALSGSDIWGDNLQSRIMVRTAACSENRMSGCPLPVMSSAGSGNHGIMAIIPLVELAVWKNIGDNRLKKALAISHLLNVYIKQFTGRLSALCGCGVSAASAASSAMVWLLGGSTRQMEKAIINMAGNITGIICDGGKAGCALKLATSASAALMSAQLALKDVAVAPGDGVAAATAEDAIKHMGRVSSPGMIETDAVILDIMIEKEKCSTD